MDTTNSRSCRSWWKDQNFDWWRDWVDAEKWEGASAMQRPTTHPGLGLLVGADIDQQPHTVRVTIHSGTHQRRESALRIEYASSPHGHASQTRQKQIQKFFHMSSSPNLINTWYMQHSHGGKKQRKFKWERGYQELCGYQDWKIKRQTYRKWNIRRVREREKTYCSEKRADLSEKRKRKVERSYHGAFGYWECQSR